MPFVIQNKKTAPTILKLLESPKRTSVERRFWLSFITSLNERELKNLEKLLTENPSYFEPLTRNLIQKSEAFETNNSESTKNILEDDEAVLSEIERGK